MGGMLIKLETEAYLNALAYAQLPWAYDETIDQCDTDSVPCELNDMLADEILPGFKDTMARKAAAVARLRRHESIFSERWDGEVRF